MKHTTIDQGVVLQMALVGYEMERSRIEAAIAEIQAELGSGDSSRSTSTATDEPPAPRRKRFTARVWLRQNPQKPAETRKICLFCALHTANHAALTGPSFV